VSKFAQKGVEIKGLREITRGIEKLGADVADLKGVFQRIGARAISTANSGTPIVSGALRASNKQSKRKNSVYLYSGGARTYYARFVHWGTIYTAAEPYLSYAVKKDGPWAVTELDRELTSLLRKTKLN
jgi:HK97 gp10 family phage protein